LPTAERPSLRSLRWETLSSNIHGDWINQRTESFAAHLPTTAEDGGPSVFELRSLGLATGRDAWNYNSSRTALDANVTRMTEAYNAAADAYDALKPTPAGNMTDRAKRAEAAIKRDPRAFSWNRNAFTDVARGSRYSAEDRMVMRSSYRPFHPRWVEAGRRFNAMTYRLPRLFPSPDAANLVITVPTLGARSDFATCTTAALPDLHLWPDGTICFPLYIYADQDDTPGFFARLTQKGGLRQNITDHALDLYRSLDTAIEKDDDVFFYVYGILHSPDYRTAFAADLKKSLPRIPQVETAVKFWAFSRAGRELAELHTDYESVDIWPELKLVFAAGFDEQHADAYRVLKMKHPKLTDSASGTKVDDRTRIVYNDWITVDDIPERAYDYELGSRSAIAWVMDSWRVRTDKASGIMNDPNAWAIEHDDPTYILDLVGRVVTVSLRTLDIVESLPTLSL